MDNNEKHKYYNKVIIMVDQWVEDELQLCDKESNDEDEKWKYKVLKEEKTMREEAGVWRL